MSKVLVVYGTKSGCTAGIAEQIGRTLSERGAEVDVLPAQKAGSPAGYDAVIVGSGVRAGKWHGAARNWVAKYASALTSQPVAFFTCGLSVHDGKMEEAAGYTDAVIEASGIHPVDLGLFAGWFEPDKFPLVERSILKMMKSEEGDFRDFDAVAEWTAAAAPKLGIAA